jgi:3-oxoacyl-[acyl-carrier protein] reductase
MTGRSNFAVVTAAAAGIGRAVAAKLVEAGWQVVITDIDEAKGEETAAATGCAFHRCDMADPDAIRRVFATFPVIGLLVTMPASRARPCR